MRIKIGADGGKNCHLTITGQLSSPLPEPVPILLFKDLSASPKSLRLDGLQFAIQEKMGFNLWWMVDTGPRMDLELIMPIESRGGFDFEKIKPIQSPEMAVGIAMTSFKVTDPSMSFMIMLDLTKQ